MSTLELTTGRLSIDGTPSVLLCSSVFPFRIPSQQWEHRLRLVRESGYRMIDLYVHWGFHEEVEGQIDLSSPERDLQRFLDLAHDQGLLVMARPGPYICSETDGGGLPWWLHGRRAGGGIRVRTTDPAYLKAVGRWFDAVMPVLAAAQTTRGGPVALVQIENELDFFDCPDPDGYMTWLAQRTRAHGIDVPIIACAGQGELHGAGGDAHGVVPTVNLYPADDSTTFDAETRYYSAELEQRELPLMVTETNRLHRTLRREILAGARLVAPYLQTSGFNHLVRPSAGNWGDPGNLMTYDYDFGGYISPDGRRRPEYDEAIRLTATLEAWGERLATARPVPLSATPLTGMKTGGALALEGGGLIVGPAEVEGLDTAVRLRPTAGTIEGDAIDATVTAGTCPFWAVDVPLRPWGRSGTLTVATAELVGAATVGDQLQLTFEGTQDSLVKLDLPDGAAGGGRLIQQGIGRTETAGEDGAIRVEIREGATSLADPLPRARHPEHAARVIEDPLDHLGTSHPLPEAGDLIPGTEELGLADGRLRVDLAVPDTATELLLLGAADLVRIVTDGAEHGVHVPHGAPLCVPLAPGRTRRARVITQTWGRANFDDARRPALHLGAGRGPGMVLAVTETADVSDLWRVRRLPDQRSTGDLAQQPLRELGGWSSPQLGRDTVYVQQLPLPGPGRVGVLRLHGLTEPIRVSLDGGEETLVSPAAPVIVLGDTAGESGEVEVAIRAPHVSGGLLDRVELLETVVPDVDHLRTVAEEDFIAHLTAAAGADDAWFDLPGNARGTPALTVDAEHPALVRLTPPAGSTDHGALLDLAGRDVAVTVMTDGRRVSRHVLGAPAVAGGDPRRSWIPAEWFRTPTQEVLLCVESLTVRDGIFEGAAWVITPL